MQCSFSYISSKCLCYSFEFYVYICGQFLAIDRRFVFVWRPEAAVPLADRTVFSPLNYLCTLVKNQSCGSISGLHPPVLIPVCLFANTALS